MRNISDSKISYYARNKRTFLSNPRIKVVVVSKQSQLLISS
jgi:hypothetical protein